MPLQPTTTKYTYYLLVFFLLATILPFFILSFYNFPVADDYIYATAVNSKGFWDSQLYWYLHWTGRYFSTLLISANPLSLNWMAGNAVFPITAITLFCYSLYYFLKGFRVIKQEGRLVVLTLFLVLFFANLHTVSQAFYWMPGLYTYLAGLILFLFHWGYFVRIYTGKGKPAFSAYLLSLLMVALLTGTSEVAIFYQGYIALAVAVYCYVAGKAKLRFPLWVFAASVSFGLISLLAPGNFIRKHFTTSGATDYFLQAKRTLHLVATKLLPSYTFSIPLLAALFFLGFYFSTQKTPGVVSPKPRLKLWQLFAVLSGGFAVSFLPHIIANTSELRAFNFSYFTFLLAVVCTVVYAGYYYQAANYFSRLGLTTNKMRFFLLIVLVGITCYPGNNIWQAYKDVLSGSAACYYKEVSGRHAYLTTQQGKTNVAVPPLTCQPKSLFSYDLSPEKKHWQNQGLEAYFKIDTLAAR